MSKKPTIAIIIPILRRGGGAEKVASWLSFELAASGCPVHVATFCRRENEYPVAGTRHSLAENYERQSLWRTVVRARQLVRLFVQNNVSQVIAFTEEASLVVIVSKLFGFRGKLIVAVRNNPKVRGLVARLFIRFGFRLADQVIANSHQMAAILKKDFGLKRVVVVENPIDIASNKVKSLEPLPTNFAAFVEDRFVFLNVGRLIVQKGQKYLLESFAKVAREYSEAALVIVGSGVLEVELKHQAEILGIVDRVLFVPVVENIYPIVSRADVFVLSSLWEGLPNALLEALSLNKTVVCSDCLTGPREILMGEFSAEPIVYPHFAKHGVLIACPPVDLATILRDAIITKRWGDRYHDSAKAVAHLSPGAISFRWQALLKELSNRVVFP